MEVPRLAAVRKCLSAGEATSPEELCHRGPDRLRRALQQVWDFPVPFRGPRGGHRPRYHSFTKSEWGPTTGQAPFLEPGTQRLCVAFCTPPAAPGRHERASEVQGGGGGYGNARTGSGGGHRGCTVGTLGRAEGSLHCPCSSPRNADTVWGDPRVGISIKRPGGPRCLVHRVSGSELA